VEFAVPGNVQAAAEQKNFQNKAVIPQSQIHRCLVLCKSDVAFLVVYHRIIDHHAGMAKSEMAFVPSPVCAAPNLDIAGLRTRIVPILNYLVVMV
jgi:hypothetical protein